MRNISDFEMLGDPLLSFRWELTKFPNFPSFQFDPIRVEKVDITLPTFDNIPVYMNGMNRYYLSTGNVDPISFTFYENYKMTTLKMLSHWRSLMYQDGFYGLPSDYKHDFELSVLKYDTDSVVGSFRIVGAWPSSVDGLNFDDGSGGRISVNASFVCDNVIFKGFNVVDTVSYGDIDMSKVRIDEESLLRDSLIKAGLNPKGLNTITDLGNLEYIGFPHDPDKNPNLYFSFN